MDYIEKYKIAKETNNDLLVRYGIEEKFIPPHINPDVYEAYAIEEMMKNLNKKLIKMKLDNNELMNSQPHLQKLHNEVKERQEKLKPFYFITISPKPNTEFDDFKTSIEECINWIFMEEGIYAYEQRGGNDKECGNGFHVHIILIKYNVKPKTLYKRLLSKFQKFCEPKNGSYENVINVRQKRSEFLQDKLDYIRGLKHDDDKPEKVYQDKIWRQKLNLQDYYTFDLDTDKEVKGKRGGAREGSGRKKKSDSLIKNEIIYKKTKTKLEF